MRLRVLLLFSVFKFASSQSCRDDDPRDMAGVCQDLCDKSGNCTIKAALLLPQNGKFYANLPAVRSVFDLALADPAITQYLRPGMTMELTNYDVLDCDAAYAIISAIDAYNDCSHVYFGPSCDFALASVARITKFLGSTGTPLITTGGFSFDFAEPKQNCFNEFYMMVRAGPLGFKDLAYFLIDLFRHFNWKQLLLIDDPDSQLEVAGKSSCYLMMKTFANFLKIEEIMYIPWDTTSDGGLNYTENLKFYLGYKYTSKYGWTKAILLYDTPAYHETVGVSGGFILASTIHQFMTWEGIAVMGRELRDGQPHEEMLVQDIGNNFANSSFSLLPIFFFISLLDLM